METSGSFMIAIISETHNILHTSEVAAGLKGETVGIAGLGGLGSNAALEILLGEWE